MTPNTTIAARLTEIAKLLEADGANPFRIRAYLGAAQTVRELDEPLDELLLERGLEALADVKGIGPSLARTITQLAAHRDPRLLVRLRASARSGRMLRSLPGIGKRTAARLREERGIVTLEDLETALYDGSLATFPGMGAKRLRAIRDALTQRMERARAAEIPAPHRERPADEPSVEDLLAIDAEYRERAATGTLPTVAPRQFNPTGEAWLPVLHTYRGGHHYTAYFSNSVNAHRKGTLFDWVVIHRPRGEGQASDQWTVITGRYGRSQGKRIVAGREKESVAFHARQADSCPEIGRVAG